jgi:hypothetical protein
MTIEKIVFSASFQLYHLVAEKIIDLIPPAILTFAFSKEYQKVVFQQHGYHAGDEDKIEAVLKAL